HALGERNVVGRRHLESELGDVQQPGGGLDLYPGRGDVQRRNAEQLRNTHAIGGRINVYPYPDGLQQFGDGARQRGDAGRTDGRDADGRVRREWRRDVQAGDDVWAVVADHHQDRDCYRHGHGGDDGERPVRPTEHFDPYEHSDDRRSAGLPGRGDDGPEQLARELQQRRGGNGNWEPLAVGGSQQQAHFQ